MMFAFKPLPYQMIYVMNAGPGQQQAQSGPQGKKQAAASRSH
jgi:hypothetical protein